MAQVQKVSAWEATQNWRLRQRELNEQYIATAQALAASVMTTLNEASSAATTLAIQAAGSNSSTAVLNRLV